jgi:hypothetical protein
VHPCARVDVWRWRSKLPEGEGTLSAPAVLPYTWETVNPETERAVSLRWNRNVMSEARTRRCVRTQAVQPHAPPLDQAGRWLSAVLATGTDGDNLVSPLLTPALIRPCVPCPGIYHTLTRVQARLTALFTKLASIKVELSEKES